jgi:hypothetical protein
MLLLLLDELRTPLYLFGEQQYDQRNEEDSDDDDTDALVNDGPTETVLRIDATACKNINSLLSQIIHKQLGKSKSTQASFDQIIKWYNDTIVSDESFPPIIAVWDDIDVLPSYYVLHLWLQMCSEQYRHIPIYNVLRVSSVKAASVLQSVFVHNVCYSKCF